MFVSIANVFGLVAGPLNGAGKSNACVVFSWLLLKGVLVAPLVCLVAQSSSRAAFFSVVIDVFVTLPGWCRNPP